MQPANHINTSLQYIEENLKTSITTEELADMAGYSSWHYSRLFAQATGLSVAAYISKRRLDRALSEIIGSRRAIDVALEYGFDTYAGFYKAFVRVYGDSPKRYLKKEATNMFTQKQLRDILTNWDVPQDTPILDIYIMDGTKIAGNVWAIGEEYILKIGRLEDLRKNLQVSKALAKQGFAAATPIPTKSGAEYLAGDQIAVLTCGIKGGPLSKTDRFGENRRDFGTKYGANIARLHNALSAIETEIAPHEQNLYTTVVEWALPEVRRQNAQYQLGLPDSFFDDYIQNFGVLFDALPKQLIHRDPNPSNILFDGSEVSGFIDFDLSERNVRLWDPCYCATGILSEWRGVADICAKWPDILAGILHGYDSVNPLTDAEKTSIFYVICSIQMICVAWFNEQTGNDFAKLAKTNREMLQFIVTNQSRIAKIF